MRKRILLGAIQLIAKAGSVHNSQVESNSLLGQFKFVGGDCNSFGSSQVPLSLLVERSVEESVQKCGLSETRLADNHQIEEIASSFASASTLLGKVTNAHLGGNGS